MEAPTASCSTPRLDRVTKDAAVGSPPWNLAVAKILKEDGVLGFLVKSLSQEDDLVLKKHAARTLRNLAAAEDHSTKLKILNEDGALKGLVNCLPNNYLSCYVPPRPNAWNKFQTGVRLRKIAVQTLGNLAAADENCIKIVNEEGALKGLVESLSRHNGGALQEQAARALKELARGSPEIIASEERAVLGLVKALSAHDRPGVQEFASLALQQLLEQLQDNQHVLAIIKEEDMAIGDLVNCLSVSGEPGLQKSALQVLHLSLLDNCTDSYLEIKKKIVEEKSVIGSLVKFLSVFDDHELQEGAADFLYDLAVGYNTKVKERIADEYGAITGLVKCMAATNKPSLQQKAMRALVKLASYENDSVIDKIAVRIANEHGAIAGFVKCLSANCDWQKEFAAAALARLVEVEDSTVKQRIIDEDGAISGLVKCLASPSIRAKREATRALAKITKGSGDCMKRPKLY